MRVSPKSLKDNLKSVESSLSWLMTLSETTVEWNQVPNFEIKILKEKVNSMSKALDDIYKRLYKYEVSV